MREVAAFRAAMLHALRSQLCDRPVLASAPALLDYLQADMVHSINERARVLHLNAGNILIRDEIMAEGSIDEVALYAREIIGRALEIGSAAIILVHNHPSGDPTPSRSDIDLTKRIARAGQPLGIAVHDHLIIASGGHRSMRTLGLL
ncbi:MAG: JAB domain-containing protein [Pseudomonadota bacterium]